MPGTPRRPRVFVAVEPHVLRDALADVLSKRGDDVIVLEPDLPRAALKDPFDAAVVTIALPEDVLADVVIELPDHEGSRGTGRVSTRTESRDVPIDGLDDLLDLLR